jgi:hypothetical protein
MHVTYVNPVMFTVQHPKLVSSVLLDALFVTLIKFIPVSVVVLDLSLS